MNIGHTSGRSRRLAGLLTAAAAAVLALAPGCGTDQQALNPAESAFRLQVDPASHTGRSGASIRLGPVTQNADGQLEVPVCCDSIEQIKSLYLTVSYDSRSFNPISARSCDYFCAPAVGLELAILSQPGSVHLGLYHLSDSATLTSIPGDGRIATLLFSPEPFAAGRSACQVPNSQQDRMPLSLDPQTMLLNWEYRNTGDYNQDGRVAVSDLAPIGLNFGAAGPFDSSSNLAQVDGNADGRISVGDLTPIGLNFGTQVKFFEVYSSPSSADYPLAPDAANGAGAELKASVDFDAAIKQSGKRLSWECPADNPAWFWWVRPSDGISSGIASEIATDSAANLAPVVQLSATPASGDAPLQVTLEALASDPDGSIAEYRFDAEGDGVYESVSANQSSISHIYTAAGNYVAAVQVEDDLGAVGSASLAISVGAAGNAPPLLDIELSRNSGAAPLYLEIDLSGSSDSDGIETYFADMDNDGTYEQDSVEPFFQTSLSSIGDITMNFAAADSLGALGSQSVTVEVLGSNWQLDIVDSTPAVQMFQTAIAGLPDSPGQPWRPSICAAHRTASERLLKYFRAPATAGGPWLEDVVSSNFSGALLGSDLLNYNGLPHLAACVRTGEAAPYQLWFRTSASATGSSWSFPDIFGPNAASISLDSVIWLSEPAVLSRNGGGGLTFSRRVGGDWFSDTDFIDSENVGYYAMCSNGDEVYLLFTELGPPDTYSVYCVELTLDGSQIVASEPQLLGSQLGGYSQPDCLLLGDRLLVAFSDGVKIWCRQADVADLSQWSEPVEIGAGGIGSAANPVVCRLDQAFGAPVCAWSTGSSVMLSYADSADAGNWFPAETVDNANGAGHGLDMAMIGGSPCLSYWKFDSKTLMCARRNPDLAN